MSAFVVSNEHINAIVNFVEVKLRSDYRELPDAETLGQMLLNENARSVNARYSEDDVPPVFEWKRRLDVISPVQMLKALRCLNYQSCETDDWETTPACKLIDQLTTATFNCLPGYDDAEWEINDPRPARSVKGGAR